MIKNLWTTAIVLGGLAYCATLLVTAAEPAKPPVKPSATAEERVQKVLDAIAGSKQDPKQTRETIDAYVLVHETLITTENDKRPPDQQLTPVVTRASNEDARALYVLNTWRRQVLQMVNNATAIENERTRLK